MSNDQTQFNQAILIKEIDNSPKLKLTIIESQSFSPQTVIMINACGYPESKRKVNDGQTYIGSKDLNIETGQSLNDIVFSRGEVGMGNRHCLIKYIIESKSYYIKDMCEGTGTFIQIEKSINLHNEYVISCGNSHIFISINPKNELRLKFLDGPNNEEE